MEISVFPEPLYIPPRPHFTAGFQNYFTLEHEAFDHPSDFFMESESLFLYVRSGRGSIAINGLLFPLEAGYACLLHAYHAYSVMPAEGETLLLDALVMDYPLLSYLNFHQPDPGTMEEAMDICPVVCLPQRRNAAVKSLLAKLEREDGSFDSQSPLIKAGIYGQIRVQFMMEAMARDKKRFLAMQPLGWKAWTYLTKYCGNYIDAEDVAKEFSTPLTRLNRELRRISTYDCRRLLSRARALIAASMLLYEDLSTQYISNSVGFSSENSFFRSFREWRGVTPQQYRERMLSEENLNPRHMIDDKPFAILNYISSNYRENITLKTAAQKLYLSETVINRILRDCFGAPFYRIVTSYRLQHAEGLLNCTDMPVCDIAADTGFASPHTFTRLFKQHYGVPPSEYRRKAGGR